MKTVTSILCLKGNVSPCVSKIFKLFITTISCRIMKCCPSAIITHMHIKLMFVCNCLAKIQMSIECCSTNTVATKSIFEVYISSYIGKISNKIITTTSRRNVKCCPSVMIRYMYIKLVLINESLAVIQMFI